MALDQVKLDWASIDQSMTVSSSEVPLAAAPNSVVDKYVEIVEHAGLEPMALEANATAVARVLVPPSGRQWWIVDFGSLDTDVSIVLE